MQQRSDIAWAWGVCVVGIGHGRISLIFDIRQCQGYSVWVGLKTSNLVETGHSLFWIWVLISQFYRAHWGSMIDIPSKFCLSWLKNCKRGNKLTEYDIWPYKKYYFSMVRCLFQVMKIIWGPIRNDAFAWGNELADIVDLFVEERAFL